METTAKRRPIAETILALALCLLGSLAFTFPWFPNSQTVPTAYVGEDEFFSILDASIWTYMLSWGAMHPTKFYEAPILSPLQSPLAGNDPRLTEGLWSIPFFRTLPPVTAWGVSLLFALTLTAALAYHAGRTVSGSRWGGVAAAILFAFGLFRAGHVCHIEGTFAPLLFPAIVAFAQFCEQPSRRSAILFGASLGGAVIEYSYNAVALAACVPPALAWAWWRRRLPFASILVAALTATIITTAALAPVISTYYFFHRETGLERSLAEVDMNSADLEAWLTGPHGRILTPFGPDTDATPDQRAFPGFVLLLLAALGARPLLRRWPEAALIGLAAAFLSLGTLRLLVWKAGWPHLEFQTPWEFLAKWLLPFRAIRSPGRLALLAHVILALAAALGAARFASAGRTARFVLAALLLVGFIEARASIHEVKIRPDRMDDPAYAWIAGQPEEGAVVDLPMGRSIEKKGDLSEAESLFAALTHRRATPNGTLALLLPWHESIATHLARPRPGETREILKALGVRYAVARDETTAAGLRAAGLREAWRSTTSTTVFTGDTPSSVPRTPAEFQERLFAALPEHISHETLPTGRIVAPRAMTHRRGRFFDFMIEVENTGRAPWCANGALVGAGPIGDVMVLSGGWRGIGSGSSVTARGIASDTLGLWGRIPHDLDPGESASVHILARAPSRTGRYLLELHLTEYGRRRIEQPDSPALIAINVVDR